MRISANKNKAKKYENNWNPQIWWKSGLFDYDDVVGFIVAPEKREKNE